MFEFVAYQIAAVTLLSTTTLTLVRTMVPPQCPVAYNNIHLCAFTTLTAGLHYVIMGLHKDLCTRVVIRYADWVVTAPIIRLQMCALEKVKDVAALRAVFFYTLFMLVTGLAAELVGAIPIKVVLGTASVVSSALSISAVDPYFASGPHIVCRGIYGVYSVVFFVGFLGERYRTAQEIGFTAMDTLFKTVFTTYIICNTTHFKELYRQLIEVDE